MSAFQEANQRHLSQPRAQVKRGSGWLLTARPSHVCSIIAGCRMRGVVRPPADVAQQLATHAIGLVWAFRTCGQTEVKRTFSGSVSGVLAAKTRTPTSVDFL